MGVKWYHHEVLSKCPQVSSQHECWVDAIKIHTHFNVFLSMLELFVQCFILKVLFFVK